METWLLVMFAGGPGLAALLVQLWTHRAEKPTREAGTAQVLIETGDVLMGRMQREIDDLRDHLATAENEIAELRGRLEVAEKYAESTGRLNERLEQAEAENERLRSLLPHREAGASADAGDE